MRWAVVHKRAGVGQRREVWVVILDVPKTVGRGEVLAALESWQRWPSLQARVSPSATLSVVHDGARLFPTAGEITASAGLLGVTWEQLAPVTRILSVRVPSGDMAAMRAAVARSGHESLQGWALDALCVAAGVSS